jgi:hypothetical protein
MVIPNEPDAAHGMIWGGGLDFLSCDPVLLPMNTESPPSVNSRHGGGVMSGPEPQQRWKRFGEVAVEKGFVDQEDVMEALRFQLKKNMSKEGEHRPIGLIMAQMGLITRAQIAAVLKNQI